MKCRERSIFVLDILGRPTLAFEAEDLALAEAFVHAPRFVSSLGEFFANKRKGGWDKNIPLRIRVATRRGVDLPRLRR
jgi:hypothetical protein